MFSRLSITGAAAALALAGCATTQRSAEVTRFHLDQPIPADSIALLAGPGIDPNGLEFRGYADAVARELAAVGFRPVAPGQRPAYQATLKVEQTSISSARESRGRVSFGFGFGGGGYRSGGGIGVGSSVPIGRPRTRFTDVNMIALQIRRVSDASMVWEGRAAETLADSGRGGGLGAAVPELAHALLAGFPGPAGTTVRVPVAAPAR